jgi:hypothetical protein
MQDSSHQLVRSGTVRGPESCIDEVQSHLLVSKDSATFTFQVAPRYGTMGAPMEVSGSAADH